ncbi:hypothetical protein AMJ39_07785 [candidate division TA06 bacterium DG_24]|uniref:Uncharacterized protein n=1 Tax=candidate division TA06 bacterium DG_24 TaxID=1703770 RepID=A0A0S7WQP5_UNCT6|nr:MAG: hypothetical protein AMJ39_07785 [candidate division TA06 bacterium DG_24]
MVFCAALVPMVTGYRARREPQPQPTPSTTATPVVAQVIDSADPLVDIEEARPQITLEIGFGDEDVSKSSRTLRSETTPSCACDRTSNTAAQ